MKKLIKILLLILFIPIFLFSIFLLYLAITDFKPDHIMAIEIEGQEAEVDLIKDSIFNLLTWNVGYAGLGQEMDFFYDGGQQSGPSEKLNQKYLHGIRNSLREVDSIDFWLLQEIDLESKRTYHINQKEGIQEMLYNFHHSFVLNYVVAFVPVPISNPMGKVKAGMMTSSLYKPSEALRVAYPLIASWPKKMVLLDRCFILNRHPLANGKDLLIMNTHNTAYIYDPELRVKELEVMRRFVLGEYNKGNYVIAGGDWNMNPPDFEPTADFNGHKFVPSKVKMEPTFFPDDWQWAYDNSAPTNRQNYKSFVKGENGTTYLDYFLVSPNVELLMTKTMDFEFEHSDHNPVFIQVKLK